MATLKIFLGPSGPLQLGIQHYLSSHSKDTIKIPLSGCMTLNELREHKDGRLRKNLHELNLIFEEKLVNGIANHAEFVRWETTNDNPNRDEAFREAFLDRFRTRGKVL